MAWEVGSYLNIGAILALVIFIAAMLIWVESLAGTPGTKPRRLVWIAAGRRRHDQDFHQGRLDSAICR